MTQFRAALTTPSIPVSEASFDTSSQTNRRTSDAQADVTIIGAGFAGLTAGALLAKDGFKVQVLERDVHPGGCAANFTRTTPQGDFRFAVGATVAAGLEHLQQTGASCPRKIFGTHHARAFERSTC
jgi:2-polyprenyl-6-methoxyphenol hydroxylase-like FAD-dependent oxidoreductase